MRLTLHNFRCYQDAQYEFPDYGLILLSGSSGAGKSSLLKAILYALYGVKAVRKPYSFGTATCNVILEFLGLKIQRTNRPNRVIVNDDIEDDAAQAFIDEKIGMGYDEFMISSYIPQKNNSSILSLAQTEQLRLIKTLAFEGNQNERYKTLLKEMARESATLLVEKRAQVEFTERELGKLPVSNKLATFPLAKRTGETREEAVKRYRARMSSFSSRMGKMLEERAELNDKLQKYAHAEKEFELNADKLADSNKELAKVNKRYIRLEGLLKDMPTDMKDQVADIKARIRYIELEKECVALQTQFDQLSTEEERERKATHRSLEKNLWKKESEDTAKKELADLQKGLQTWGKYLSAKTQLKSIDSAGFALSPLKDRMSFNSRDFTQDELVQHYTEIAEKLDVELTDLHKKVADGKKQVEMEKNSMQCPECDAMLYLRGSILVSKCGKEGEKYDAKQIHTIEKKIDGLNKSKLQNKQILQKIHAVNMPDIVEIDPMVYTVAEERVVVLSTYITQNIRRQDELNRLKRAPMLTSALSRLKRTIEEKSTVLSKSTKPTDDVDILQKRVYELEAQAKKYKVHKIEMVSVKTDQDNLHSRIQSCERVKKRLEREKECDPKILTQELTTIEETITKAKKKHNQDEKLLERVEEYLVYCEREKQLKYWQKQLDDNIQEQNIVEKSHAANLILKDKYTQAEIMALETTIGSINEHTRYYLDTFFVDQQLKIVLETAYKGKKLKTFRIDTMIQYKGNEYDGIAQLSGGEFDRCTLASICGINSMLGSPILILDESLASLDTDANTDIIRFLGELAQDKLILVCSHEAVTGIFDEVINLR